MPAWRGAKSLTSRQGAFATKSFAKVNRGVYQVDSSAAEEDLEYYAEMRSSDGQTLLHPVTVPAINHTLVVPAIESTLKRNSQGTSSGKNK